MARIGGYGRRSRLLLAGLVLTFAFGLWSAGAAHANCAEMPTDPMCMSTSPQATSPSATNPPINRTTPTPAPIDRGTPTQTTPNRGTTPTGSSFIPPAPEGTDFQTTPVTPTTVAETPSIATNGQSPQTGGGTANATDPPPPPSTGDGGSPLLPLGLAVGAVAVAAAPLGPNHSFPWTNPQPVPPAPPPPPPPPPPSPATGAVGGPGATADWFVYKSGLDNHFSVAKLWEGGTIQIPGVQIVFGPSTFVDCWAFVAASAVDTGPIFHAPGTPPLGFPV